MGRTPHPEQAEPSVAGHLGGWRLPAASSPPSPSVRGAQSRHHPIRPRTEAWGGGLARRVGTAGVHVHVHGVQRCPTCTCALCRPAPAAPHARARTHTALPIGSLHRCTPPRRPHTSVRPWAQDEFCCYMEINGNTPSDPTRCVDDVRVRLSASQWCVRTGLGCPLACPPSPLCHAFVLFGQSFYHTITWRV
jgi:hypothetical protein